MRLLSPQHSRIRRGPLGVHTVEASSQVAAYYCWGKLDSRGRLFQMDLLRRVAAGRLAELFGPMAADFDREQRRLGLEQVAEAAYAQLPAQQRRLLDEYAAGVRAGRRGRPWPLEHVLLRTRPAPWRPHDSILVMLSMYQQLALDVEGQRTQRALTMAFPPAVAEFLMPRGDEFSEVPDLGPPLPVDDLLKILADSEHLPSRPVMQNVPTGASNCWAIAPTRTADGRPILANDMHLGLGVPNIFHRVDITFPEGRGAGFAIPGLPLLVCGSNGRVAWGLANIPADCTRLLPVGPQTPARSREEVITVRGAEPIREVYQDTEHGPVLPQPLCGQTVALQWTALNPAAVNLSWFELLGATTVEQAIDIAHRHGGVPVAVVFADDSGTVGRTVAGRFAQADVDRLRPEFVAPQQLPSFTNPECGYVIWANDPPPIGTGRTDIGHNYPASYRRSRLAELLAARTDWTVADVFAIQLDHRGGFYDFYRDLAAEYAGALPPELANDVRATVQTWDGGNGPDSIGPALFAEFRRHLQDALMARIMRVCSAQDDTFRYSWRNTEPVLRRLLRDRVAAVGAYLGGWDVFIADRLADAAHELREKHGPVHRLRWRDFLPITMNHPMGGTRLTRWLNLPPLLPDGGFESVAAFGPGRGPAQRLVVSPGQESDAIVQMPGGQSGSPFSRHYRDHHRRWRRREPAPLRPIEPRW